jgi:Helix-turn-helix domain
MPDHCQGGSVTLLISFSKLEVQVVDTTLKKGTRVTGVDRSKLATLLGKRYDDGESIRSLAASTGRSYGFVHRILTETGVSLRGRGGATRSGKAKV